MTQEPSIYFSELLIHDAISSIAFHVECQEDIHGNIQFLHNAGKKVGLAILTDTPIDHLDPYLLEIDYVLTMTVKGGFSGTPFIPEVVQKIRDIRGKTTLPIIVDGGIGKNTLPICLEAGSDGAVMASSLFSGWDISWLDGYFQ